MTGSSVPPGARPTSTGRASGAPTARRSRAASVSRCSPTTGPSTYSSCSPPPVAELGRMKIESLEAIPIEIPLRRNFGGSTYAVLKRSTIVTRLRTDSGLVGEVYNGDNRDHGPELVRLIHEALAPRVRGLDVAETERVWDAMFALSHTYRARK